MDELRVKKEPLTAIDITLIILSGAVDRKDVKVLRLNRRLQNIIRNSSDEPLIMQTYFPDGNTKYSGVMEDVISRLTHENGYLQLESLRPCVRRISAGFLVTYLQTRLPRLNIENYEVEFLRGLGNKLWILEDS